MNQQAFIVFIWAFVVSAFAGLAALLRTNTPLNWKSVASAISNSGVLGLGIALLWYTKFQDNVYFLIGVCVIAGLGGSVTIDYVLEAIRKGGLFIKLGQNGSASVPGVSLDDRSKK